MLGKADSVAPAEMVADRVLEGITTTLCSPDSGDDVAIPERSEPM